ncbi:Retrovirus-related Pol polyprotein from type-1 retrotransposable element R1 [Eumeta japonica]|uniref:Retrovirus-related Pol polyprotein from type-1 retrotransposable element R1 n=1 Tax=Eumeta variegata TaxID=151549 RepID=A0A4C1XNU3_EUMVA|nr:Retrovirus-related Pol polyprotein from type-1 retrotransposable element R1 [Eumeta japonica]
MLATSELLAIAKELKLDVILIQEQYCGGVDILQTGDHALTGVYLDGQIVLISAYFQYSHPIDEHLVHLQRVLTVLRGRRIVIGVDCNAHSTLWHCTPEQCKGRGFEATQRQQKMEDFIYSLNLVINNVEGEPATFAGATGESNIDITLRTRGLGISDWRVLPDVSVSDHRLLTYNVDGTRTSVACAEPVEEPCRFRDRDVDWNRFQSLIHFRMGHVNFGNSTPVVCAQVQNIIVSTSYECLGVRKSRQDKGYEWWSGTLDQERKVFCKKRRMWQRTKKRGGWVEENARSEYRLARLKYRRMMREAQLNYFKRIADTGECNIDVWAAYTLLNALCPDDDSGRDSNYHKSIRLAATFETSGSDAPPLTRSELGRIIKALPNTAPGADGLSARIIQNAWYAASAEITEMYARCVRDGMFPDVWKSGRLIVLPKGNGRPLTDPKAYRPITLLPVLGKILERIILKCSPQIMRGISEN